MRIMKALLWASVTLPLVACQSMNNSGLSGIATMTATNDTAPVAQAEEQLMTTAPCCTNLQELSYRELEANSRITQKIDGKAQVYEFADGKSFVAAFRLPQSNRPYELTVQSLAGDQSILNPKVLILDSQFDVVRETTDKDFKYAKAKLLVGDRLEASLNDIGGFRDDAYLVIYSPAAYRQGVTTIMHPAKQYALATQRQVPEIDDPQLPHSPFGLLAIETAAIGKATPSASTSISAPADAQISAEEQANELIRNAVSEGDIDEALRLVEDAEANGSTSARPTFIEAVKSSRQ